MRITRFLYKISIRYVCLAMHKFKWNITLQFKCPFGYRNGVDIDKKRKCGGNAIRKKKLMNGLQRKRDRRKKLPHKWIANVKCFCMTLVNGSN